MVVSNVKSASWADDYWFDPIVLPQVRLRTNLHFGHADCCLSRVQSASSHRQTSPVLELASQRSDAKAAQWYVMVKNATTTPVAMTIFIECFILKRPSVSHNGMRPASESECRGRSIYGCWLAQKISYGNIAQSRHQG